MLRDAGLSYSDDVFSVRTAAVIALLRSQRILMAEAEKHAPPQLVFNTDIAIEPHASFNRGLHGCSMGAFSYSNSGCGYGLRIGRYCSIGSGLQIMGADHFPDWISTSPRFYGTDFHDRGATMTDQLRNGRRVEIGHDVWIGANVTLRRRLRIGNGAIIATGSVVTADVPDFFIVAGVPARPVRPRLATELIQQIQALQWWRYRPDDMKGLPADRPEAFLTGLRRRIESGAISPFEPSAITRSDLLACAS